MSGFQNNKYQSMKLVAGVDEAGRGPLAGPVVAAAVILDQPNTIAGLTDSKKLTAPQREALAGEIKQKAIVWSLGRADVEEIDRINILQATLLAMQRAVAALTQQPEYILVDGNCCPAFHCPSEAVIKGDLYVPAISAASIIAKVARDEEMRQLDRQYPGYGFAAHKGYYTQAHIEAMEQLGISPIHRRSYAPVKELLVVDSDSVYEPE